MCKWLCVAAMFLQFTIFDAAAADMASRVVVDKSDRTLMLYRGAELIASYRIALGGAPVGPKRRHGDKRTPEGRYVLDRKLLASNYYKAIHISYPNDYDDFLAEQDGVSPGGDVLIHGQRNHLGGLAWITQRFNWTDDSIALSNQDMDAVWAAVNSGTPIEIIP